MQKLKETVVNYQELMENRSNTVHIFKNKQIYRESVNMCVSERAREREWMRKSEREREKEREVRNEMGSGNFEQKQ